MQYRDHRLGIKICFRKDNGYGTVKFYASINFFWFTFIIMMFHFNFFTSVNLSISDWIALIGILRENMHFSVSKGKKKHSIRRSMTNSRYIISIYLRQNFLTKCTLVMCYLFLEDDGNRCKSLFIFKTNQ